MLEAVLEGRAFQNLPLHHNLELRVLVFGPCQPDANVLAQGSSQQDSEEKAEAMKGELARHISHLLLKHSIT